MLNLEPYQYMTDVTNATGVRVVVHSNDTAPRASERGITVAAGTRAQIGVRRSETQYLSDCYPADTAGEKNPYTGMSYEQEG